MTFSPLEERVAVKAKLDSKTEKKEKETKSFSFFSSLLLFLLISKKSYPASSGFSRPNAKLRRFLSRSVRPGETTARRVQKRKKE